MSVLSTSRSNYYNYKEAHKRKGPMTDEVLNIFRDSKKTYGTRRIKAKLEDKGYIVSRRRIKRIMAVEGLVSIYTKMQYKVHASKVNESKAQNELDRNFNGATL